MQTEEGRIHVQYNGHKYFVYSLAWSHDDRFLLSVSSDQTARIWDIKEKIIQYIHVSVNLSTFNNYILMFKNVHLNYIIKLKFIFTASSTSFIRLLRKIRYRNLIHCSNRMLRQHCPNLDEKQTIKKL